MDNNDARIYCLRHSKSEYGAFGTLFNSKGIPFAVSLENEETLIPVGDHFCPKSFYHAGNYETFEILIEGRTRILFHMLNWDFQSKGCIGVGESYDPILHKLLGNIPGIAGSGKGFKEFWELYKDFQQIRLHVREFYIKERVQWPL